MLSVAIVAALCAAAAVTLLLVGGKPVSRARNQAARLTDTLLASRQLYVASQEPAYFALLPAGWSQIRPNAKDLTGAVAVRSPVDDGATITVGLLATHSKTLAAQGAGVLKDVAKTSGFHQLSAGGARLSGGRAGWELSYQARGSSGAYYLVRSCNNTYGVAATVGQSGASLLRARIASVAATLQGNC